jgi:hypothetical protein
MVNGGFKYENGDLWKPQSIPCRIFSLGSQYIDNMGPLCRKNDSLTET